LVGPGRKKLIATWMRTVRRSGWFCATMMRSRTSGLISWLAAGPANAPRPATTSMAARELVVVDISNVPIIDFRMWMTDL